MTKRRERSQGNGKYQATLRMDEAHFSAIDALAPGLGSNRGEIIRFIVIDWMKQNLGIDWMREKGLLK